MSLFLFGGVTLSSINSTVQVVGRVGNVANTILNPFKSLFFGDYVLKYGNYYFEFRDLKEISIDFNSDNDYNKYKDYVFKVVYKLLLDDPTNPTYLYYRLAPRNPLRFWDDKYVMDLYTTASSPDLEWAENRWEEQRLLIYNGELAGYVP